MSFSQNIINWYHINKRDLPWRNTRDPYLIWLSEIILQQTRVDQGLPYYLKFSEQFPTVGSLAKASEEKVMRLWQGLGYYSRARNLHAAAKEVITRFGGKFPAAYDDILSLKGIGEYTAAAISSFAFDQPHPVVDGNVFRLISRYYGISDPIDKPKTKKIFTELAGDLMKGFPPHDFNQAIMEFGARQCKPASPDCSNCPLNLSCHAYKLNLVSTLPVKENKTKVRDRFFHYLIIESKNSFYIRKRNEKDIWQGLHDFPLIEAKKKITPASFIKSKELSAYSKEITFTTISEPYEHLLSHQKIHARFYHFSEKDLSDKKLLLPLIKVNLKTITKYALPKLVERYLDGK